MLSKADRYTGVQMSTFLQQHWSFHTFTDFLADKKSSQSSLTW